MSAQSAPGLAHYLARRDTPVLRVREPLSVDYEITALQHVLAQRGRFPVVRVEQPVLAGGAVSPIPVVTNLFASRVLNARVFGIADHRRAAAGFASVAGHTIAPVAVTRAQAPVQELVAEGEEADLGTLPVLRQHQYDVAPYLTAAHITTFDPDSGVDNTSIQRCAVHGPRLMSFHAFHASHNALNIARFHARGEPCPMAVWIGHHPAVSIGAQVKLGYPESHWPAAGGLSGGAVRLVPTVTHGAALMVPADAEIVVEGWCPPGRAHADGPLGEYHGYMGLQIPCPVFEVSCITRRVDALYQDCGAGLHDHLICENLAIEAKILSTLKPVAPSLVNVHLPFSGRRFHVYLQFRDPRAAEVRDALVAALGMRRHRTVVAVDEDVDIFDDGAVMRALATRVDWGRDLITFDGLTAPPHDPSLPPGAHTITKGGIDATTGPAGARGAHARSGTQLPRPDTAPALERAVALLEGVDDGRWPRQ